VLRTWFCQWRDVADKGKTARREGQQDDDDDTAAIGVVIMVMVVRLMMISWCKYSQSSCWQVLMLWAGCGWFCHHHNKRGVGVDEECAWL